MLPQYQIFFKQTSYIKEISQPLADYFDITYFAFKRTFLDGSKIYLFNNAYLYEYWFNKEYYRLGNREGPAQAYESSVNLWLAMPDPYNIYQEIKTEFNIYNGITITEKHLKHCDFYFFASDAANYQINNFYLSNLNIMKQFILHFQERSSHIIDQVSNKRLILPYVGHQTFCNMQSFAIQRIKNKIDFLLKMRNISSAQMPSLTRRELECIPYLSTGMSSKAIANILGISVRTFEDYLLSLKIKLHCTSKQTLIALLRDIC